MSYSSETVIWASHASVGYAMNLERASGMKEWFIKRLKGEIKNSTNMFWALNDVSFEIKRGEIVGLIGRNGAGKSTLLKMISNIISPIKGDVGHIGTISPLLELGSGFDPELTGQENVFLNGAFLGYTEKYLRGKYDEILEFSELGSFINAPLKTYSSGMSVRLAFSIATVVQPEILIVDEVLAVGDAAFQEKSYKRMMELMNGGVTVLMVSHSAKQILDLCTKVIWLENGQIREIGQPAEVCARYQLVQSH